MTIKMLERCGDFAENKDIARNIRFEVKQIYQNDNELVVFDFSGVDSTTQSFIHALISEFFQCDGEKALDKFEFKNCSKAVKSLLTTVINYSLE